PAGGFLIMALFLVSQSDGWASLTKAWLRVCGIVFGGGGGLVALVSFAGKTGGLFSLQALLLAAALLFSRTTTAPYACALFGLVFYIVVPEFMSVPAASLERGLWIIFSLAVGALFGTLSQLAFWPDDPEELLLIDLATRLKSVEQILART